MIKMKAIVMTAAGDSDVLSYQENRDKPVNEGVSLKIKAAGVNPIDTKVRAFNMFYPDNQACILGCDFAGEVLVAAGDFSVGDKVWGCHGGLGREQGSYAEYNTIKSAYLALMPKTLSFVEAAAAPLVLITAWGALYERGRLQAGETVLIHAGAGGVGHVAIQLAKLKGARVITTVSTPEKAAFVRECGADEVILYTEENVLERVLGLTEGEGADLVFDTVGGDVLADSIEMTKHYGRLVTLLSAEGIDLSEARMRNLSVAFELMLTPMLRDLETERAKHIAILNQCASLIDTGKLKIKVSQVLPLQEAKQAHDIIESGHSLGKIVLEMA